MRLASLAINSRYISKQVDISDNRENHIGKLFVDIGLQSDDKDRLPVISQNNTRKYSAAKRYWKK